MTFDESARLRVIELLHRLREATATEAELRELESRVLADAEAKQLYVRTLGMQASLRWLVGNEIAPTAAAPPSVATVALPASQPPAAAYRRWRIPTLIAALFAVAALLTLILLPQEPAETSTPVVARLVQSSSCIWPKDERRAAGDALGRGKHSLLAGVAEILLDGGVTLIVEGPAEFELRTAQHAFLHSGRIVAKITAAATQFVIETPQARLVDRGTEYGVGVDRGGRMLVQVFDGEVAAEFKATGAATGQTTRLSAGEACQWNGEESDAVERVAFADERFIRRLPDPVENAEGRIESEWLVPYNRDRTTSIEIPLAAAPPQIDGDLADWNPSEGFHSHFAEPYGEDYYVHGRLRYDAEFLYIAADVGDPAPLHNVFDPKRDANAAWRGGAVQVRLSTDPALGYPLTAEAKWVRGKIEQPADTSRNLVHLTLWYFAPQQLPCLSIEYGMRLRDGVANPGGYRGAFQPHASGRGYTLEYAIPWKLLHTQSHAPPAGSVLGACWNIHWSDEGGRLWKGYLVDVLNPDVVRGLPDANTQTFARAATWGKAIYGK